MELLGGIEGGGTKFVCAVGTEDGEIINKSPQINTTTPGETLGKALDFFRPHSEHLRAIGIASFGPIDLDLVSPTYGFITTTPKTGWQNFDFVGEVRRTFNVPIAFDTDVNGAALGEHTWGAAQNLDTFIYLTVGTGIGGGGMVGGRLMHGLVHPEMGHIILPHQEDDPSLKGFCEFHPNCLEGLASGPAIEKRWGQKAENLSNDHQAWELEARYLALALTNFILTLSPQRIILGGGVMHNESLFLKIRPEVQRLLDGYVKSPSILEEIDRYIVPPGLRDEAGINGAIALAKTVVE